MTTSVARVRAQATASQASTVAVLLGLFCAAAIVKATLLQHGPAAPVPDEEPAVDDNR